MAYYSEHGVGIGRPEKPISRTTDPETSKQAELKHTLSKRAVRMRQVLVLVERYPGKTASELGVCMEMNWPHIGRSARETPRKRCSDLEGLKMVKKGPKRECKVTGEPCQTWHITPAGIRALEQ